MSTHGQEHKSGRKFGVLMAALSLAAYVPFLFLPAIYIGGAPNPVPGWEGVLSCFLFPGAWPLAAAHLLFYFAVLALPRQHWRAAQDAGAIAFAVGALFGIPFLFGGGIGQVFKLLAMGLATAGGVIGVRKFRSTQMEVSVAGSHLNEAIQPASRPNTTRHMRNDLHPP